MKTTFCLLFCLAFSIAGCGKNMDSTAICKAYLPAVVEIRVCDNEDKIIGNATGTVISGDGLILTNRHDGELVGITTFRLRDNQSNIVYGTSFALPTNTINKFVS